MSVCTEVLTVLLMGPELAAVVFAENPEIPEPLFLVVGCAVNVWFSMLTLLLSCGCPFLESSALLPPQDTEGVS